MAESCRSAPDLHCDICNRCKFDEDGSFCSVNGRRIDDVLECPPWCIERDNTGGGSLMQKQYTEEELRAEFEKECKELGTRFIKNLQFREMAKDIIVSL